MRIAHVAAPFALALATLTGCSGAPDASDGTVDGSEQVVASDESALLIGPDFRFDGGTIVVHDGFTSQNVVPGATARVSCNTKAIRVSFKEKNAGILAGGPHSVRLGITGNPFVTTPAPALAPGALNAGVTGMTPVVLPSDTYVPAQLMLDSTLAVPEMIETNNTFPFTLYRVCI